MSQLYYFTSFIDIGQTAALTTKSGILNNNDLDMSASHLFDVDTLIAGGCLDFPNDNDPVGPLLFISSSPVLVIILELQFLCIF